MRASYSLSLIHILINEEKHRKLTKENLVSRIKAEDWLYILDDINSERLYLILGKEKALLFDTGYGFCDYRPLIHEVTDLPLTVVCSCLLYTSFLPYAHRIIDATEGFDNEVKEKKMDASRAILIGTQYRLTQLVRSFRSANKNYMLYTLDSRNVEETLYESGCELAFIRDVYKRQHMFEKVAA